MVTVSVPTKPASGVKVMLASDAETCAGVPVMVMLFDWSPEIEAPVPEETSTVPFTLATVTWIWFAPSAASTSATAPPKKRTSWPTSVWIA